MIPVERGEGEAAGLYVHVPFCRSRCVYCDFYSTTRLDLRDRYVDAVCAEMRRRVAAGEMATRIGTVYLGGGTPSQLTAGQLARLFECVAAEFDVADGAEVTVEVNPDDVTAELVAVLRSLPVNRLSFGVQSFDNGMLRFMRRRHTAEVAVRAVSAAQDAGFGNIGIDLMFGFPGQTLAQWEADVATAARLSVQHVSGYSLTYEGHTPLVAMRDAGRVEEVPEQVALRMYELLVDGLRAAGFEHYEISNFARGGFRSRHNSGYWRGVPYWGFGAAAHSFDGCGGRRWNVPSLADYVRVSEDVERGVADAADLYAAERLDAPQRYNEFVMTGLRTAEGVDLRQLERLFGRRMADYCLRSARRHLGAGTLCLRGEDGVLALTRKGLFVSDDVMSDLMCV